MQRSPDMPLWVFLGLSSINTRKGALILFWSCFAFSVACIPLAYYQWVQWVDWSWVAIMFPCSLWYWLCIRWIDKHTGWA
ncbi:MAG: hypothetical protein HZB57_12260 [Gammaproteobacteria bacterium]|nr:hypothetical protein [Gammaproteobacteria bacterium]